MKMIFAAHFESEIATTPKMMRTPPATNPPISNAFFIGAPLGVRTLSAAG
jgi:hypothetical protein